MSHDTSRFFPSRARRTRMIKIAEFGYLEVKTDFEDWAEFTSTRLDTRDARRTRNWTASRQRVSRGVRASKQRVLICQAFLPSRVLFPGYIFVGAALFMIFVQGFKYIVDVYLNVPNSAVSGNTFARSFFGATFPLFTPAMYHNSGFPWATSVLASIS